MTKLILILSLLFAGALCATELKQSTAYHRMVFMVDSTDHVTGKASLSLTITSSQGGAAFGSISPTVTDRGSGWYDIALTTTHTNTLGDLCLHITGTGADPSDTRDVIIAWDKATALSSTTVGTVTTVTNAVTAGTVSDKTGYALTSAYDPAKTASQAGDVMKISSGTGANQISLSSGTVTVGTNNDKSGYTASTVSDKTGYSLSQSFPSNFSSLAITAGGAVTAGTVSDKTGYSLSVTPPTSAAIASAVWQDTTAGDFTMALSIGKSVLNGVTLGTGLTINGYTGNTPQTGDAYARIGAAGAGLTALGDSHIAHLDADVSSRMPSYTQPTGFLAATFPSGTIANTTNITAGTITTATNLTNLPSIPANWLTAAGIASGALNGKGDWLLSSGYTVPPTVASIATGIWQDLTSGSDFSTPSSIGKLLKDDINATISSRGTSVLVAGDIWDLAISGHTTAGTTGASLNAAGSAGDPWATSLPGSYGAGTAGNIVGNNLNATVSSRSTYAGADTSGTTTLLGRLTNTRAGLLDNLDVAISSRMGTFALPTNFSSLAITVGGAVTFGNTTIGTVTTLTNLPSIPANWLTATGIASSALNGKGDWLTTAGYTAPPSAANIATAIWQDATSTNDFTIGSSIGKLLVDDINATISSRSTYSGGDTSGTITLLSRLTSGRASGLDNLDAAISSRMAMFTLPTNFSSLAITAGGLVDINGKTGFSLISAYDPAKVDPWGVTLPSSYTGQKAGALLWKIGNKP